MRWIRFKEQAPGYQYHMASNRFIVQLTGGSIIMKDRQSREILKRHTGHHYLYTGDISPDESECFGLENGKHFYVYSLQTFELIKRVTLPKCYDSIDMYGHYSEDGKYIYIPASRWVSDLDHLEFGYYEYVVCKYETERYTLDDKVVVDDWTKHRWELHKFWDTSAEENSIDPDLEAIMKIILD